MKVDKTFIRSNAALPDPLLCGTDIPHTPEFTIDREKDPFGTNLVFSFRHPGVILTRNGLETALVGDCIIHSTEFYQYHTGVSGAAKGYRNDFIHVPPQIAGPLMKKLKLPFDVLLHTGNPAILTPFILDIQYELSTRDCRFADFTVNILERMFLAITRARETFERRKNDLSSSDLYHYSAFCALREQLFKDFRKDVKIEELARAAGLSPERFAVLYKKFFNCSPYAELLQIRIEASKRLLLVPGLSIKEVADACGWQDIHYFARIFRKKCGMPPAAYRKSAVFSGGG